MTGLRFFVATIYSALLIASMSAAQSKDNVDQRAARKASDAFVADLVANRVGLKSPYAQVLDLCGRPLDSKILDGGTPIVGEDIAGGHRRTTLQFLYLCKTSHYSDQVFAVGIELADDGKYQVSGLSCRKRNASKN